jgi:leucine-rich repeat protein SHOC2
LQWAREHGCTWDEGTCKAAAENGHCDVAHWAWEHGCPWDPYTLLALREGCSELRALWDEAAPVTAWQGVTFGEAGDADVGRVVAIFLMGTGLTGDLPAALGRLTALKRLYLNSNKLTSVPAALGGLTALSTLWLQGNQLTSMPAALGGLTALKTLWLCGNKLTSVPAEWEKGGTLEQSGCHILR